MVNLQGLVVIDVVEGTALPSLPHMVTVLSQRPQSFPSPQAAVHWARKSGEPPQPVINTNTSAFELVSSLEHVGQIGTAVCPELLKRVHG